MSTYGRMMEFAAGSGLWFAGLAVVVAAGTLAVMAAPSGRAAAPSVLDVWAKIKAPPRPRSSPFSCPQRPRRC